MAVSRNTRSKLEKGAFDSVEDDWLAQLGEEPGDLDYFVGTARALSGFGEDERARLLLEMLDAELAEQGRQRVRLELLRRAGALLRPQHEELHAHILEVLGEIHEGRQSFAELVTMVGLERAPHDIPKTWEKIERLESLLVYDPGAVVRMKGQGVGRVSELNVALASLKVAFAGGKELMVGLRAAPKMLEPLAPEHVLRRKLEAPEELLALAEKDPPELLRVVIESYGRPLKAAEVRRALDGVVSESAWSRWWTAARKHPQVVAGAGGRQTYGWAASSGDALESLWERFREAPPRSQIDELRRHGGRDSELAERMAGELATAGERAAGDDPTLALEIALALERSGHQPAVTARELLASAREPASLIAGIEERGLRLTAYELVRDEREDWPQLYSAALENEEDGRSLELLTTALARDEPRQLERFLDRILAQPQRAPAAFVWIAERAAEEPVLAERNPLRLLQQILAAPGHGEFARYRVRLLALAESGHTLPRLLGRLEPQQAPLAAEAVDRASAFEPYQRDDLGRALALRFPELVDDDAEQPLYGLPASIEAKRDELAHLLKKEIPTNRRAIEEARALGDLRENFEYKSARQRHEYLTARATELKGQLVRARPLSAPENPVEVRIGCRVRLTSADGSELDVTLLGPWESDPDSGVISYESELGQRLLGKKVDEEVDFRDRVHTVAAIEPYRP